MESRGRCQELGCAGAAASLRGWVQQSSAGLGLGDLLPLEGFLELGGVSAGDEGDLSFALMVFSLVHQLLPGAALSPRQPAFLRLLILLPWGKMKGNVFLIPTAPLPGPLEGSGGAGLTPWKRQRGLGRFALGGSAGVVRGDGLGDTGRGRPAGLPQAAAARGRLAPG